MNSEGIAECGRGNQHNQLINLILILQCFSQAGLASGRIKLHLFVQII